MHGECVYTFLELIHKEIYCFVQVAPAKGCICCGGGYFATKL